MTWEYGGAYRKYDMDGIVELPNESRVMACDWLEELPDFMLAADTLFIDPPWNIGNANSFYTKAERPPLHIDFPTFSETLLGRVDEIDPQFLFIEMGKQYLSWYLEACKARYKYVTFYNSTYYHRQANKCYVIHATDEYRSRRYGELEDMDEEDIIAWLCSHHQYDCIGDLCMGRGLVGKHAFLNGKRFVGTELNRKRLAVLVEFILTQGRERNDGRTVRKADASPLRDGEIN